MKIKKCFRKYFLIFFWFGQSSWNIGAVECDRSRFNRMIPAVIYLIASISFTYPSIAHCRELSLMQATTGVTIICLVHFSSLVLTVISVINTIFYNQEIYEIIEIFDRTMKHLQYSSGKRFTANFYNFKRAYGKKCAIIFTLCVLQLITKVSTKPLEIDRPMRINIFTCIMNFYKNLAKVHVLFYIDLMLWCYELNSDQIELNESNYTFDVDPTNHSIKTKIKPSINVDEYINKLRHCKYIHFKLWKISKLINSHFGWMMIINLLNSFIEGSLAAFWTFMNLRTTHYRDLPRKFINAYKKN